VARNRAAKAFQRVAANPKGGRENKWTKLKTKRKKLKDAERKYRQRGCPLPTIHAKRTRRNTKKGKVLLKRGDKDRKAAKQQKAAASKARRKATRIGDEALLDGVSAWPKFSLHEDCDPADFIDPVGMIFYGFRGSSHRAADIVEAGFAGMSQGEDTSQFFRAQHGANECVSTQRGVVDAGGQSNRHHIRLGGIRRTTPLPNGNTYYRLTPQRFLATVGTPHYDDVTACDVGVSQDPFGIPHVDIDIGHGIPDDGFIERGREEFVTQLRDDRYVMFRDLIRNQNRIRPQCGFNARIDRAAVFLRTERP